MAFTTRVNLERHARRLREIHDRVESSAVQALLEAGEAVRQDAMESIRQGTVRGPGHVPSRPGEPPMGDTGRLETSIDVELRRSGKTVNVVARAPYAAALEFGTARMAARPFMRPAAQRNRSRLVTAMVAAANGEDAVRVFKNSMRSIDAASSITGQ